MYRFADFKDAYKEAKKYCVKGKVATFPPYVTFELSTVCNYKCPICHLSYSDIRKEELPIELFKNAVDEIAKHGSMIRLIGYCEPLLYSGIKEAIRYVKEKGLLLHITTNGSLLNDDMIKTLLDQKVDSIIVSLQGFTEEEYCVMRGVKSDMYRKVLNNVRSLYRAKGKRSKPFIKITTTLTERDDMKDKDGFLKTHLKYADEVQISGYTSLMHLDNAFGAKDVWNKLKVDKPRAISNVNCFIGNYEMLVKADGDICTCCGAYAKSLKIGNIRDRSLSDIWQSESAKNIRNILWNGDLDKIKECSVCSIRYEYEDIGSTVMNNYKGITLSSKNVQEGEDNDKR